MLPAREPPRIRAPHPRRPSRRPGTPRPSPTVGNVPVHGDAPVGPFPEGSDHEEYDKLRRRVLWKMPSGLYLLGSRSGEERNLMTLNWASQVAFEPKLLAVSVEQTALTHRLVREGRVFSLNLVDREDRAIVRKFVKPVEADPGAETLNG